MEQQWLSSWLVKQGVRAFNLDLIYNATISDFGYLLLPSHNMTKIRLKQLFFMASHMIYSVFQISDNTMFEWK